MDTADLLVDAFGRIRDGVHSVLDGADIGLLTHRVDPEANTVAWLVWHLTRIQDDHIAAAGVIEQRWTADGWAERCGLPFDPEATGYGHSAEDVAAVRVKADLLRGYHDAAYDATVGYVQQLGDGGLDRVVDERWDPPVTLGVRLVSVVSDDLQHVGQAAYVRGLAERAR
jgi:hypothetical protein